MNDAPNASAPVDGALAEGSGEGGEQPTGLGRLDQYYQAQEADQIDNQSDTDDDADGQQQPDGDGAQADDDSAGADDKGTDGQEGDQSADGEADADATEADFKALEGEAKEYLTTVDQVKEKFARNADKNLVALTAEYGVKAQAHDKLLSDIGGERFVPGITTIAEGLKTNNPGRVLEGVVQTNSVDGLAEMIGHTTWMGVVGSTQMLASDDPVTQALGRASKAIIEASFEERWGHGITLEKLDKFAQYEKAGWFEKIEKWQAENYIPKEELDELLETSSDPRLMAANTRIAELERQQEEKNKSAQSDSATQTSQLDNSFSKLATDEIGKSLSDFVWKTSVLRDVTTDSADLKADKAFLRGQLLESAVTAFQQGDNRKTLLEGYRQGKANTAVYQTSLAEAINAAILTTKPHTSRAESILARLHGKSPNSRLAKPGSQAENGNGQQQQGREPTELRPEGDSDNKPTGAQIRKNLEERIIAYETGNG